MNFFAIVAMSNVFAKLRPPLLCCCWVDGFLSVVMFLILEILRGFPDKVASMFAMIELFFGLGE